jgi:hypothetical protein
LVWFGHVVPGPFLVITVDERALSSRRAGEVEDVLGADSAGCRAILVARFGSGILVNAATVVTTEAAFAERSMVDADHVGLVHQLGSYVAVHKLRTQHGLW